MATAIWQCIEALRPPVGSVTELEQAQDVGFIDVLVSLCIMLNSLMMLRLMKKEESGVRKRINTKWRFCDFQVSHLKHASSRMRMTTPRKPQALQPCGGTHI